MTPERLAQLRQFANYATYHVPLPDVRFPNPNPAPDALRDADAGDDVLELCAALDAFLAVEHDNAERMRRGVPPPPPPAVFDWNIEKDDRDKRPQFSQLDLDQATKPLHAEIERLRKYHGGSEVCEVCQKPTQNGVWCCDGCLDTLRAKA